MQQNYQMSSLSQSNRRSSLSNNQNVNQYTQHHILSSSSKNTNRLPSITDQNQNHINFSKNFNKNYNLNPYKPNNYYQSQNNYQYQQQLQQENFGQYQAQNQQQIPTCINHTNKNALYQGEADQQITYYCQRCAILLASQGFNVQKIISSNNHIKNQNIRKKQVQSFLSNVKNLENTLDDKKNQVRQLLINSQQFYGTQIQEINDYFKLVIQSLELQKNKCYNYILNQRKNAQQNTRQISQTIDNIRNQLSQMIQDIEESIDAVYEIDQPTYRPVITNYQNKLSNFQKVSNDLKIQSIELRKVQFEGVPQSIYSISDVFIKNSVGQNFQNELMKNQSEREEEFLIKENHNSYNRNDHARSQSKRKNYNNQQSENASLMFSFEGQTLRNQKQEEALRDYLQVWD